MMSPKALLESAEALLAQARASLVETETDHRLAMIHLANAVSALKRATEHPHSDSLPPIFALNRDARMTAEDHFRKSRELVRDIMKK